MLDGCNQMWNLKWAAKVKFSTFYFLTFTIRLRGWVFLQYGWRGGWCHDVSTTMVNNNILWKFYTGLPMSLIIICFLLNHPLLKYPIRITVPARVQKDMIFFHLSLAWVSSSSRNLSMSHDWTLMLALLSLLRLSNSTKSTPFFNNFDLYLAVEHIWKIE